VVARGSGGSDRKPPRPASLEAGPAPWAPGATRVADLDRRWYKDYVDEHRRFDALVRGHIGADTRILDAGAGRGLQNPYDYRSIAARVAGADLDAGVLRNPNLTDACVADLSHLPYPDGEFDVVISKYVFEHLAHPRAVLRELRRVLRPGGYLLVHTPNRHHYVALIARMTPTRFHAWVNERRGRQTADTFPTEYRANDRRSLVRLAERTGFAIERLVFIETKPDYLVFSRIAYRVGIVYERVVNRWEVLEGLRVQLLAELRAI
jgi:SAM-dependent methyltransferase